jgi:hypothetical protein
MQRIVLAAFIFAALAGCMGDKAPVAAPEPQPFYEGPAPAYSNTQPANVQGLQFVAQLTGNGTPYPSASGVWPYGNFVFGSGLGSGFFIANVTDPANPVLVYDEADDGITIFSRDADIVAHPDGRVTLVLATQSNGMHLWDVTDPTQPVFASVVTFDDRVPNHNVAVVPGTELVFNSPSGGVGSSNDLVDVRDPYNPIVLGAFGTHGCHDITFHGTFGEGKFRAYCAGIQRSEVWDLDTFDLATTNFGIKLTSVIEFGPDSPWVGNPALGSYPVRTLHHLAMVNADATVLIIGDEQNGGGTPGGCLAYDDETGTSSVTGALWFYDISDETTPRLLSWLSPPLVDPAPEPSVPDPSTIDPNDPESVLNPLKPYTAGIPNCTAHFGTLIPGEEKLVMAWYSAGVLLIDFTDPATPVILDQYMPATGTNPWDARVHGGYVYTGDIVRGMDVLKLV